MKKSFFLNNILIVAFLMLLAGCNEKREYVQISYQNPVIRQNCPDPTVIDDRERTGYFYAYSTQHGRNDAEGTIYLPVYRSRDMVEWEFAGDGFGPGRPQWSPGASIWAPDINYFDGHYVLYYAQGVWGDPVNSASGVAVSDSPVGPFEDKGMIVDWESTGVGNSIDPVFFDDGDARYLFWGSLGSTSGVWGVQLSDDGLKVREGCRPVKLVNNKSEGTYVKKRNGSYYLFASKGSCCKKEESTYRIIVGRSDNPLGPYLDPQGNDMINDDYEYVILSGTEDRIFAGPGHDAQIITDDAGDDWMCYHVYWSGNEYKGRCMAMDRIVWSEDGWPSFKCGSTPSGDITEGPRWFKE